MILNYANFLEQQTLDEFMRNNSADWKELNKLHTIV